MLNDLSYLARRGRRFLNQLDSAVESPKASERSDPLTVESVHTHIYFYSGVNSDRCLALLKELRYKDNELRNEALTRSLPEGFPATPIWLHINSGGGSLLDALAVSDQIKRIETPIYSLVEGNCASAATIISMACSQRYIQPSAFMMIHEVSSIAWGKYSDIQDEINVLDMLMERLITFYQENSKMKRGKIKELLSRNSWFNSKQVINLGLADKIY
jgi:ATP-dependent protease ClpP protease subunit